MTDIQIKYWDYVEGKRHNLAYEGETNRHNQQTEAQSAKELVEVGRHNLATESVSQVANNLRSRELGETIRHNVVNEGIQQYNASSQRVQANASAVQANASMIQANAATRNAESNHIIADANRLKSTSEAVLNASKRTKTDIESSILSGTRKSTINSTNANNYISVVGSLTGILKDASTVYKNFKR